MMTCGILPELHSKWNRGNRHINFFTIIIGVLIIITIAVNVKRELGELMNSGEQPEVSIKYTHGDHLKKTDEDAIPDSKYYDTIQEAMFHNGVELEEDEIYQKNIDEIIKKFENEEYISIFFRSVKDENEECFTMAKFKKKEIGYKEKYAFIVEYPTEHKRKALRIGGFKSGIEANLALSDYMQNINIDAENTRFIYGMSRFEKIYDLKVEGQSPMGIIPFESFEEQWYFWYYDDLKSSKAGDQLEFTTEIR